MYNCLLYKEGRYWVLLLFQFDISQYFFFSQKLNLFVKGTFQPLVLVIFFA